MASILGDVTNTYFGGPCCLGAPSLGLKHAPVAAAFPIPSDVEVVENVTAVPADPQKVTEYVQDIFQVLRREELVNRPSPNYMDRQQHVNAKMRGILVDWLVDVHRKYKLRSETLFLTVHIIDSYLAIQSTQRKHLQLVGVSALLISAKFEEVYPPQVKDLVYVTDKAYTGDDILQMEVCILRALNFNVCYPTSMHFLERYCSVNDCTDAHRDLAQYLLELTLVEYKMLKYSPSHLASASILLSNKLLRRPAWAPLAVQQTQMTESMLKSCAKEICNILESAETSPLTAVRKKFSQQKHHSVAKLNFGVGPDGSQDPNVAAMMSASRRSTMSSMMDIA